MFDTLQWRHNEGDAVSNHQPHDCLLNRLFRRRSKKTLKLRVTGICPGNSSVTGEFPTQRASNAENVSIWWRHRDIFILIGLQSWWIAYIILHHKWPYLRSYKGTCDYVPIPSLDEEGETNDVTLVSRCSQVKYVYIGERDKESTIP